jgi:hypothetical protein
MNKYTKHTPGPWIVNSEGQITDLQDRTIVPNVHAHNVRSNAFPRGSGQYVAEDDGGEANARLIAAAPEMLDALRLALTCLDAAADGRLGDVKDEIGGTANIVDEVITKAEGGAE